MKIGQTGNRNPRVREHQKGLRGPPQVTEEREPLVDIIETDKEIRVVAEMPGVEKTDIKLQGTEDALDISVDVPQKRFHKEVQLPAKVKVKEASSTYKNGVLEVILPKFESVHSKGEPINIG
jgi:HSP20 family protein